MNTIYHPPGNDDHALRNYTFQFFDLALNRYPNSGIYFSATLINFHLVVCVPHLIKLKTRKLCQRARRPFYLSNVKDSRNSNPSKWWNSIKRLAGLSKRQPLNSIYQNGQILKEQEIVEHVANSFCHVSKDIIPLNFAPMECAFVPDQYIQSVRMKYMKRHIDYQI